MYLGYYSMKKVASFDDYAVAGRNMPLPIFFAAIAATLCGGGATIGRVSFMHTTGIIVFFALTGVVINQIFSGLFISERVHNAGKNVYSLGDLFGMYYGRSGRLLCSIFGFLLCVGAFVGQDFSLRRSPCRYCRRPELLPLERQGAWRTLWHSRELCGHRAQLPCAVSGAPADEGTQA